MAKIGILTFHRSYNYGAFMQCYSLSHRLKKDFPEHTIEVIDYATERLYKNYPTTVKKFVFGEKGKSKSLKSILYSCYVLFFNPKHLNQRKLLYSKFEADFNGLPCSEQTIITDDYERFFDLIKDKYDIIIVGSDAVWEFKTYPFPNAYFLNGDFGKTVLMSYAASSDRMHYSDLDEMSTNYIKTSFSKFKYLGVRDVATENLVNYVETSLLTHHNCDPTIFLDLNTIPIGLDRVKKILIKNHIDLTKPIICVMGNNKLCKMVRKMVGKKYQIVSLYYYSKYADYFLNDLGPFEWAQVFSLFSVTVTSFFHGSILSLKNGCPTIATDYWYKVDEEHITKIGDLYKRLNLTEHYFFMSDIKNDEDFEKIKNRIEYYIQNPDKEAISQAIQTESDNYYSFKEALENELSAVNNGE